MHAGWHQTDSWCEDKAGERQTKASRSAGSRQVQVQGYARSPQARSKGTCRCTFSLKRAAALAGTAIKFSSSTGNQERIDGCIWHCHNEKCNYQEQNADLQGNASRLEANENQEHGECGWRHMHLRGKQANVQGSTKLLECTFSSRQRKQTLLIGVRSLPTKKYSPNTWMRGAKCSAEKGKKKLHMHLQLQARKKIKSEVFCP